MEVSERNANALNDEQVRQRNEIAQLVQRVERLEQENVTLQGVVNSLRGWVTSRLTGTGATANSE